MLASVAAERRAQVSIWHQIIVASEAAVHYCPSSARLGATRVRNLPGPRYAASTWPTHMAPKTRETQPWKTRKTTHSQMRYSCVSPVPPTKTLTLASE